MTSSRKLILLLYHIWHKQIIYFNTSMIFKASIGIHYFFILSVHIRLYRRISTIGLQQKLSNENGGFSSLDQLVADYESSFKHLAALQDCIPLSAFPKLDERFVLANLRYSAVHSSSLKSVFLIVDFILLTCAS